MKTSANKIQNDDYVNDDNHLKHDEHEQSLLDRSLDRSLLDRVDEHAISFPKPLSGINQTESILSVSNQVKSNKNELAVQIKSAYKSFGKQHVLKNLNLNVPTGAIYGLLGPSGCGKTTILRCVVGRASLDKGYVNVFGAEPCSKGHDIPGSLVGYMPQEIALYNEFSIDETLFYFGLLHNMKTDNSQARREFLIEFLDLPVKTRLVKNLSGGQKRRVSMAIALLQEPKLLILDEPTVGVDPLLREKIWTHLIDISKSCRTTIIITTHYIEEARKADRVGLIRNGKILAEQSPDYLLQMNNESSLENVFLKLCIKDQDQTSVVESTSSHGLANPNYEKGHNNLSIDSKAVNRMHLNDDNDESVLPEVSTQNKRSIKSRVVNSLSKAFRLPKWHNYLGLLFKDSILIRRNLGFLVFQFLLPVIQISLFCLCIGREPYNLKFGIVNNETIYNQTNRNGTLMFIDELSNHTFEKIYLNWSEAYAMTKRGELWGFIDLSVNFTQATQNKFTLFTSSNDSNVNLYLDSSNQQNTYVILAKMNEAYQNFLTKFLNFLDVLIDPSLLESPVVEQQPIFGDKNPQFINFMAPGIMITIIFTLTIGLTALMFVIEKKEGLLDRSWVAGVTTIEIMSAHVTAKLLIMIVQITILIIIANLVFDVTMKGSNFISALILLLQGFCGMSYGLAISSAANDETSVLQIAIGSVFPSLLLSGIIWPLEGMPSWIRFISNFSPLTHAAEAMRCVSSRGWGLGYFPVWFGILTVIGWSFLFDLVALIIFNASQ